MITDIKTIHTLIDNFIKPSLNEVLSKHSLKISKYSTVNDQSEGDFVIDVILSSDEPCMPVFVQDVQRDVLRALVNMGFNEKNVYVHYKSRFFILFENFEFHKKILNYVS